METPRDAVRGVVPVPQRGGGGCHWVSGGHQREIKRGCRSRRVLRSSGGGGGVAARGGVSLVSYLHRVPTVCWSNRNGREGATVGAGGGLARCWGKWGWGLGGGGQQIGTLGPGHPTAAQATLCTPTLEGATSGVGSTCEQVGGVLHKSGHIRKSLGNTCR